MNKKSILGVDITIDSQEDILEEIRKYLQKIIGSRSKINSKKIKPFIIFTPNPEIITYAQKDYIFKRIVNSSQINIPDGMGVCWAISWLYGLRIKRLSGVDLMLFLCKIANEKRLTIGLIGGRGGIAVEVLECLRKQYGNLKGWAMDGPEVKITNYKLQITNKFQNPDDQIKQIINKITKEKTGILFVGLGFPKQEYFIDRIQNSPASPGTGRAEFRIQKPLVMMVVGGVFDYIAGNIPRAPIWIREVGLEWLYRLIREPMRLGRQIRGAKFFVDVAISRLNTLQ